MKQASVIGLIVLLIVLYSSMFTVKMTENAVVLQLQEYKKTITEPGLYFKIPVIQSVKYFSKQLLVNDDEAYEVITKDKKTLLIDNYSMWRIVDPLKFLQTVRTERGGASRLDDLIKSELRVELGTHDLVDAIVNTREQIMNKVTEEVDKKAADYGIQVTDVRIKRADLPPEIANSIFNRMRTERERIAKEYRSEGKEEATKIRAETDKEKTILMAEAYEEEQKIRGEGEKESIRIYAEAYSRDPDFYAFMRSMEAYKNSLKTDTTVLMDEKSDFLEYLNKIR
ncbi:FtsH protease activity modulator HflC [Nitrospina gracilis 3/211]|uniref:Protein HflC n=1 Tax=Nitrospina gracilis (strain 3/211) TaxID=1266370 RepID=M1Z1R4_NITG3|nr:MULTISPECIES: protease modulator HflC [Nitrospina]MCF8722517.1 membrane protease subunit HflC [Nitrospina sp. Nb-3]CCQ91948.1 FtsH protease activity modulator HflC [Nitrospina gracilis 3/211]